MSKKKEKFDPTLLGRNITDTPESWGKEARSDKNPGAKIDWSGQVDEPLNKIALAGLGLGGVLGFFWLLAQIFGANTAEFYIREISSGNLDKQETKFRSLRDIINKVFK
jgi:hypothetical protein